MKLRETQPRATRRLSGFSVGSRIALLICAAALLTCLVLPPARSAADQGSGTAIASLAGDDVAVSGALAFNQQNGRTTATLASGSEVTVRTGQALIRLAEGGQISVCAPAHFSLIKSGTAITLALDYGRVHPMIDGTVQFTVFTPQVTVTPVAVGQQARELTVGLDQAGAMCAAPALGALRMEMQLSGQSMLVPEGGSMNLDGGQLAPPGEQESCGCDLLVTQSTPLKQFELSVPVKPAARNPAVVPPPSLSDDPVYKVYMPPLAFDANSPSMPPLDPQTILLVRESRVQSEVVFRGHVVAGTLSAEERKRPSPTPRPKHRGFFSRLFGIFG